MDKLSVTRRHFLSHGLKLGGGLTALLSSSPTLAAICGLTPPQIEGPYYPEGELERDSDLVQIDPGAASAKGQIIFISGKVQDRHCKPIAGALVEIWQACHSGKYNHSDDPNDLELDRNFQYWGRARTAADGAYQFRTILPGSYPNTPTTWRPPHVHFKAHAPGFKSLTTQMYFTPETFADKATQDFVRRWNTYEKVPQTLTVHFSPVSRSDKAGTFDITLAKNG